MSTTTNKRVLTAEGRKKIAEAQNRRWGNTPAKETSVQENPHPAVIDAPDARTTTDLAKGLYASAESLQERIEDLLDRISGNPEREHSGFPVESGLNGQLDGAASRLQNAHNSLCSLADYLGVDYLGVA